MAETQYTAAQNWLSSHTMGLLGTTSYTGFLLLFFLVSKTNDPGLQMEENKEGTDDDGNIGTTMT